MFVSFAEHQPLLLLPVYLMWVCMVGKMIMMMIMKELKLCYIFVLKHSLQRMFAFAFSQHFLLFSFVL